MPHTDVDVMLQSLGAVIRHERERQGLTQSELAARAGIHPRMMGRLERGERSGNGGPDVPMMVAEALGLPFSTIVIDAEEEARRRAV